MHVSCCIGFYFQERPMIPALAALQDIINGRIPFEYPGSGTPLWALGILTSALIVFYGAASDPLGRVRRILINEEQELRADEETELRDLHKRWGPEATTPSVEQRRQETEVDVVHFYRELRFRLIDLGMGTRSSRAFSYERIYPARQPDAEL